MDRLYKKSELPTQRTIDGVYLGLKRRIAVDPRSVCPVDLAAAFLQLCLVQSCGKCIPCRTGLAKIAGLFRKVLDGDGTIEDLALIESTADAVSDSADCAIGIEAANMVLSGLAAFREDFISHVTTGACIMRFDAVPCASGCPAHVDVPGYIALIGAGRYDDAIRLIRKDNPFPSVCSLICEHPCENKCRRGMVDYPVSIRDLKRVAVEKAGHVPAPQCAPSTGKRVAIVGGGPCGLTAAYFLSLMGHEATVYERRPLLGGMLRYGVPVYRLPDERLDYDIDVILSTGVKVKCGQDVGHDINIAEISEEYDSVLVTIGAHFNKKINIPGEDLDGVISAVQFLAEVGGGSRPNLTGKRVAVIGAGNVAMDATRTAIRLGAKSVQCVYRRRIEDMTALPEEIEGAVAEGAEMVCLRAPVRIEGKDGKVEALIVQPQIVGDVHDGRPVPRPTGAPEERIDCDVLIIAIGQVIDSQHFGDFDIPLRWDMLETEQTCAVSGKEGIFAGGDCVSGPATVIKAIEAGKVAAANIDTYLGYNRSISVDIPIPTATHNYKRACGRAAMSQRMAMERKDNFELIELLMSDEEAAQECSRCLRCDHYGLGALQDGRQLVW